MNREAGVTRSGGVSLPSFDLARGHVIYGTLGTWRRSEKLRTSIDDVSCRNLGDAASHDR